MGGFIRAIRLAAPEPGAAPRDGYPWHLPVVTALAAPGGLPLHPGVTYLVGENGSGKSTLLEELGGGSLEAYGGRSLHEQSHGESFLAVLLHRLGGGGLYLLDEPEAALSAQNQLTALRRIDELVGDGAQFVIATHSPLVLAHPAARILELCAVAAPEEIEYEAAEPVRLTRAFLGDRERFLAALLGD